MSDQHYTDPSAPHHCEHHLRTPTGEVSHEQKVRRQHVHLRILSGLLLLVLALCGYTAAFDLNSWPEWVVFGAICATAVGPIIAMSPTRPS